VEARSKKSPAILLALPLCSDPSILGQESTKRLQI
jgi:hypothetical protein